MEAMKALLLKERQEKLQLEMQLRDEICNEMVEQMQQREQWCRYQLSDPSWSRALEVGTRTELFLKICPVSSLLRIFTRFSFLPDSEHLDTQKELLEEMYEEKLKILKESLTNFYQEELQVSCLEPAPLTTWIPVA